MCRFLIAALHRSSIAPQHVVAYRKVYKLHLPVIAAREWG